MNAYMKYIHIASRCSLKYRDEKLKEFGLNGCQCTFIFNVCKNPGISQDKLAEDIFINKSNVTRQLAALEKSGFVKRQTGEPDRRVIEVYPTEKAVEVLPKMRKILASWNDYITDELSNEEKEMFFNLLTKVANKSKQYFKG